MKACFVLFAIIILAVSTGLSQPSPPYPGLRVQASLTDNGGNFLNGTYPVTIRLYTSPIGGLPIYTAVFNSVSISAGILDIMLNASSLPYDSLYWVETQVNNEVFSPRTQLASVPYAIHALRSDTAGYSRAGLPIGLAGGVLQGTYPNPGIADSVITSSKIVKGAIQFSHIAQNGALTGQVMKWNGTAWAAANDSNGTGLFLPLVGGTMAGPITSTGNPPITMGKGSFGESNINTGIDAFVVGANNRARGDYSTIGGGGSPLTSDSNSTLAPWSTIAGGKGNTAVDSGTTISGGTYNRVQGSYGVIAGGQNNFINNPPIGGESVISGGINNSLQGGFGSIGGGEGNSSYLGGWYGTIGGGLNNTLGWPNRGRSSTVAGGEQNWALGDDCTVAGGFNNTAGGVSQEVFSTGSTVAGGTYNQALITCSTVGGGTNNYAGEIVSGPAYAVGAYSVVSGGSNNKVAADYSTISGGGYNVAGIDVSMYAPPGYMTVGGGNLDTVNGSYGVVPGGYKNNASGLYSFAAGE